MRFEVDEKIVEEVRKYTDFITYESTIYGLRDIITGIERVIKNREIELAQEQGIIVRKMEDLITDDTSDMQISTKPIQERVMGYFTQDEKMLGYDCSGRCDGIVKGDPYEMEIPGEALSDDKPNAYHCRICGNYLSSRRPAWLDFWLNFRNKSFKGYFIAKQTKLFIKNRILD